MFLSLSCLLIIPDHTTPLNFSHQASFMEKIRQQVEETSRQSFIELWGRADPATAHQIKM